MLRGHIGILSVKPLNIFIIILLILIGNSLEFTNCLLGDIYRSFVILWLDRSLLIHDPETREGMQPQYIGLE